MKVKVTKYDCSLTNEENIEIIYDNVRDVFNGMGLFSLRMDNGESATFHFTDEEGGEWGYHIIH